MWDTKSCILEMFLSFYDQYGRSSISYRDFLREVLYWYEKTYLWVLWLGYLLTIFPLQRQFIVDWYRALDNALHEKRLCVLDCLKTPENRQVWPSSDCFFSQGRRIARESWRANLKLARFRIPTINQTYSHSFPLIHLFLSFFSLSTVANFLGLILGSSL